VVWGINRQNKAAQPDKGSDIGCHTEEKKSSTAPLKIDLLYAHEKWVPGAVKNTDNLEYWKSKADKYARALGMISVSYSLEEAKSIAKQGLK
jgi:hypothetical protein